MSTDAVPIRVRNLVKTYRTGLFGKGFQALHGIDLEVQRGSVFGLLGPNGAGKTTLIKVLLGLAPRFGGEAQLFGQPVGRAAARDRVGYLPEAHRLPGYLTGRQVLKLYGMYAGRSSRWLRERIPAWLERVDMQGAADRKVREYSKGMQQRIGLIQALVHEPELIFLDEPTDGVDPVGRAVIRRILDELRERGTTVFLNSHLLLEVEQMCDAVVIMNRGQILRQGSIEELTPRTGRVAFELGGESHKGSLESLLAGVGADWKASTRGFELTLSDEEQDAVIDRLRSAGYSIRAITPRKLTLEEAFLGMLGGKEQA